MTKRNGGQEQKPGPATKSSVTERGRAEEALRLIAEGTSSAVGEQFFLTLVKHLAIALRTRFAFIAELADAEGERVRLLALWTGTRHGETFEYATERTPCEHIVGKKLALFPAGVQELFPEDRWLRETGIESYLAIPLFDSSGNPLGHLGVMHDQRMTESSQAEHMLRIFAARAGGELERRRAEEALRRARDELELRVDERTAQLRKVNQRLRQEIEERGRDAIRENEVRALVENSPDIILRFDTELRHVYANQAIERVTGLSPQAVIGKTHAELGMPAGVTAFWQESLAKVFRSGEEDVVGFEYPTPDGTTYFESRVVPEFGQGGEVESVLVLARDITDRKRAEEALERARVALELRVDDRTAELRKVNQRLRQEMEERRRAEEALRESEVVLRATLEATADGILVVDKNAQVLHANARFAELWHVPKELLEAGDAEKLRRAVADQLEDPEAFLSGLGELYETPQESFDTLSFKDGRVFERLSRPLIKEGTVAGRVWSFRDVTERNRLEEALQRAREMLEGKVEQEMLQDNPYRLTFREFTVLHLVADGRADKEIASELVISPLTVHKHVQNILSKMNATSRTQAGVRALREGWLD